MGSCRQTVLFVNVHGMCKVEMLLIVEICLLRITIKCLNCSCKVSFNGGVHLGASVAPMPTCTHQGEID